MIRQSGAVDKTDRRRAAGPCHHAHRLQYPRVRIDPEAGNVIAVLIRGVEPFRARIQREEARPPPTGRGLPGIRQLTGVRRDAEQYDTVLATVRYVKKSSTWARGDLRCRIPAAISVRHRPAHPPL